LGVAALKVTGIRSDGDSGLLECTGDRLFHLCSDKLCGAHPREVQIEVGEGPRLEFQAKFLDLSNGKTGSGQ
jgi:hypothetical protein